MYTFRTRKSSFRKTEKVGNMTEKINYLKLINELNAQMPEKYKNEPVKHKIINQPINVRMISFDPYKELLPCSYKYFHNEGKCYINISKAEEYVVKMLYWINYHKDFHLLAPFFVYAFFFDHKKELRSYPGIGINGWNSIYGSVEKQLKDENYTILDRRYKKIIPPKYMYQEENDCIYYKRYKIKPFCNNKQLAESIIDEFENGLETVTLEYETYPDELYEAAEEYVRSVQNAYFDEMMNLAKTYGTTKNE